jgi:hypothetical protein
VIPKPRTCLIDEKIGAILVDLRPINEMYPRITKNLEDIRTEFRLLQDRHEMLKNLLRKFEEV